MAVYDLEEQEQLAEIKAWWRQHGNRVTSVLLAAALVLVVYPTQAATVCSSLAALMLSVLLSCAAVFSGRELALPGDTFLALSHLNHFGASLFGAALGVGMLERIGARHGRLSDLRRSPDGQIQQGLEAFQIPGLNKLNIGIDVD